MNISIKKTGFRICSIIGSLFCFYNSFSQAPADSLGFMNDSIRITSVKMVRPQFRADNKNIFFKGQALGINGFDAGVLLKEKLRFTLGYYSLNNNLDAFTKMVDDVEYKRRLRLNNASINTEFIYKDTRFFSLGLPVEFGIGYNELEYVNSLNGEVASKESGLIVTTDFGLSLTFKPIRWIGLKTILGYRKTAFNQVKDFDFDGVFTSIGLNLDVREIVRDFQMYNLKKKYKRNFHPVGTAVDLITD